MITDKLHILVCNCVLTDGWNFSLIPFKTKTYRIIIFWQNSCSIAGAKRIRTTIRTSKLSIEGGNEMKKVLLTVTVAAMAVLTLATVVLASGGGGGI